MADFQLYGMDCLCLFLMQIQPEHGSNKWCWVEGFIGKYIAVATAFSRAEYQTCIVWKRVCQSHNCLWATRTIVHAARPKIQKNNRLWFGHSHRVYPN